MHTRENFMPFKGSLTVPSFIVQLSIGCYENNVWVEVHKILIKRQNNLMYNLLYIPFPVDVVVDWMMMKSIGNTNA